MNREEALKKIDDMVNILSITIPEEIKVDGKVYKIKEDLMSGEREKMLIKYQGLYDELLRRLDVMDDIPEELVYAILVLKRAIIFLREYGSDDEIDDKKRWLEYVKKVSQ